MIPVSNKAKILIVEDMEPFANFVKMRLESLGYTVVGVADNGPAAVSMAEELKPDLIIMDITLNTNMTGIEAAKEILNWRRIPIIFLTAHTDKEILQSGKEISQNDVFLKPFSEEELNSAIQQAIISSAMTSNLD